MKAKKWKRKSKPTSFLSYSHHLMIKDKSRKSDEKKKNRDRQFKFQESKREGTIKENNRQPSAAKNRFCDICKEAVKGLIKIHLTRKHFKDQLMKEYQKDVKERVCSLCDKDFKSQGPAALIDHIGSFHSKVLDFSPKSKS